ncbi:MAG: ATP-binding cassette domain-containing protein [Bacteroidota bacterium]
MKISLSDLGKRFSREWIFRRLSIDLEKGNHYAITGSNGSGQSTLLQIIAGSLSHTEGKIHFLCETGEILPEKHYQHISLAAPYMSLPNEMTLTEILNFHFSLKPILPGMSVEEIISQIELMKEADKQIRYFSSGMMQRVKLAQAVFSDTSVLLLDEPCTNLDEAGISLYQSLIQHYCKDRMVIISSNDPQEYSFCHSIIPISRYK